MNLTQSELLFLRSQNIDPDEVLDVRGQSSIYWKEKAKSGGYDFVLGSYCRAGGHRLRTRAGHCIQCDTKKIAFIRRESKMSWVYMAVCEDKNVCKIGTTDDIYSRADSLSRECYGGYCDWVIVCAIMVANSGEIERNIHDIFRDQMIVGEYFKDGKYQSARELIGMSRGLLFRKFEKSFKKLNIIQKYRSELFSKYIK
jgi:T5orf172 domain